MPEPTAPPSTSASTSAAVLPSAQLPATAAPPSAATPLPATKNAEIPPAATPEALAIALSGAGPTQVLEIGSGYSLDERARLEAKLVELQGRTGGHAYLVLCPPGLDVEHYPLAPLYAKLGLKHHDVLVLATRTGRHLRVSGLPKEAGTEVLRATRETFQKTPTEGLLATLDELQKRFASQTSTSVAAKPPPAGNTAVPLPVVILGALVVALAIGALLRKPKPRPRSGDDGEDAPKPRPTKRETDELDEARRRNGEGD